MQCPKCGNENRENVWICRSCRHVLKDNASVPSRTSKLAILSLVLGILSLPLFVLAGIPAIVAGIISVVRIGGSGGALRGGRIALAGLLIPIPLMGTFVLLWSLDAPPIPNDYTVADLRSAPAEYAESFEILKSLIDEEYHTVGAPAIGLTEEDLHMSGEIRGIIQDGNAAEISETLDFYAEDIERAWGNMKEARDAIRRLDTFLEIADLSEPSVPVPIMRARNLIELARFFQVYAHLKIEQGDFTEFVADLIQLDSVYRKLCLNARAFIMKAVCLTCVKEGIVTANAIVNDPRTPISIVQLLTEHFIPLTDNQASWRNGVLSEYLLMKSVISETLSTSTAGRSPLLKPNSTLRLYKNCCDDWLNQTHLSEEAVNEKLSVWPDFYPFDEPYPGSKRKPLPVVYRCYNPLGSTFIHTLGFFYGASAGGGNSMLVQHDLLQIVLNRRLGKEVSLKARAYSDEYVVDVENKKILSPGPDGEVGTRDDIELPINPEVLGW